MARLPLADEAVAEEQAKQAGPAMERYRIVLVEDHEDNREMIRLLLGCEGHHVETAASGAEGVSLIERMRPDVALLDIGLPGMDGFEVAQRVRQNPRLNEVGLVALSGYAQASDIEKGRQAGFDAHVAKPMTPEHLLEVVEKVVASRQRGTGQSVLDN
jgi:CheY-like chemotaxis protein